MPEAPAPGKTVQIKARRQKQATGSPRRRPLRHCLQAPDSGKQTYDEQSVTNRRYSKLYANRRTSKHTVHKPKLPILTCKLEWKQRTTSLQNQINSKPKAVTRTVTAFFFGAPSMGDSYRVKVPNGGWLYQPLAQGKGVDREVESEGSRRQNPDLRYTNPI